MKILCMHLKIFLCVTAAAIVLGIVTVSPCTDGKKCSLLGRAYGFDGNRVSELCNKVKSMVCKK